MNLRKRLTVLLHVELVDSVDVAQRSDSCLNLGPVLSSDLVDPLDHLLLTVDPVQVIPEHRQSDGLQNVGVLDDDPIGSCRSDEERGGWLRKPSSDMSIKLASRTARRMRLK